MKPYYNWLNYVLGMKYVTETRDGFEITQKGKEIFGEAFLVNALYSYLEEYGE